jgi:hypothetical protein
MSMCGEIENIDYEIKQKTKEIEELFSKREKLISLVEKERGTYNVDMHLDPDKRDWEYDGYGAKRWKDDFSREFKD